MPGMNQTGPRGKGPSTGGGRGPCGSDAGRSPQSGCCGGGAHHHGHGEEHGSHAGSCGVDLNLDATERRDALKAQAEHLKNRLDFIQKELDNVSTTDVQSNES